MMVFSTRFRGTSNLLSQAFLPRLDGPGYLPCCEEFMNSDPGKQSDYLTSKLEGGSAPSFSEVAPTWKAWASTAQKAI